MIRKIYIASSWKNAKEVMGLASMLRAEGHHVFCFCDPDHRPQSLDNYVFNAGEFLDLKDLEWDWKMFLNFPQPKKAFKADKAGLDWCDTVIMLLPCGRSSHLEAGYAVGQGKDTFIYGDLPAGEFDVMYGFATACFRAAEISQLLESLKGDVPVVQCKDCVHGNSPCPDRNSINTIYGTGCMSGSVKA